MKLSDLLKRSDRCQKKGFVKLEMELGKKESQARMMLQIEVQDMEEREASRDGETDSVSLAELGLLERCVHSC